MVNADWDAPDAKEFSEPVAGTYTFRVTEPTEGSSTAGDYIRLVCENEDNPAWKLRENLYFTPKAMGMTNMRLRGLGVPKGLNPLRPHYFYGIIFQAICKAEKGKPNAQGKVYTNLSIDVFAKAEGFTGGIKLIVAGASMPTIDPTGKIVEPDDEVVF